MAEVEELEAVEVLVINQVKTWRQPPRPDFQGPERLRIRKPEGWAAKCRPELRNWTAEEIGRGRLHCREIPPLPGEFQGERVRE